MYSEDGDVNDFREIAETEMEKEKVEEIAKQFIAHKLIEVEEEAGDSSDGD